jgi:hypothetical protein
LDWRNEDVYHIIEKEGYHQIRMIPFHKITMPLYNMHPNSAAAQDCTHYCYFPQMWQPVWYELYNASQSMVMSYGESNSGGNLKKTALLRKLRN